MTGGELIDVYDDLGRAEGVRDRATVHREGWWHAVFHLLIVARRADGPVVILQRRATSKVAFGGLLDLSATGHLAAGERPIDGLRELREELGVDLDPGQAVLLGVRRVVDDTPEGMNREFCHVHLAIDDRPLDSYRPDPDEVSAVVELAVEDALDLFAGRCPSVVVRELPVGGSVTDRVVAPADFVPEPGLGDVPGGGRPSYWTTLMVMASRLAAGDRRLAI